MLELEAFFNAGQSYLTIYPPLTDQSDYNYARLLFLKEQVSKSELIEFEDSEFNGKMQIETLVGAEISVFEQRANDVYSFLSKLVDDKTRLKFIDLPIPSP